jgi:ABC-type bacteriocin/lantibiotic exporter with double-glycine peptidase domain
MAGDASGISIYHSVHPLVRLRQWISLESEDAWVVVIYTAATGLVSLVLPIAVQAVVNTVAFGTLLQPLAVLTVLVLLALLAVAWLNAYRQYVVEMIQRRVFVRLAGDVADKLVRVEPRAFDRYHGPELVNRFLEVVTVQKAGATLLLDGLTVAVQTLIGMTLLAVYHPFLLAFDVLLALSLFVVLFPMGSGAIPTAVKESKAKYALLAWLEELARHQIAVKSRAGLVLALERTNELVKDYLGYRAKHFRILLRQIVGSFVLQALASATLLGVGGWLVIDRQMTLGQLVAAELVVALVTSGITKFGKHLELFYDLMAALDKLGYLTDLPREREAGELLPRKHGAAAIRMQDVAVSPGVSAPLIQGVRLTAEPGDRIGLVGSTGSGKSSLMDVLYALRPPDSGHVEIDGIDYRVLSLYELRDQIALVREPQIFEGTVLENMRLGREELTMDRAQAALEEVGLLEQVLKMPGGLNTELATGGGPLSSGQAVQFELARALAHEPRVLLLDECLDWLEDLPERGRLLDLVFLPRERWTVIVASHNQEILGRCDRVYAIREGTLREVKR